ncbi:helix-turn-helix domain-containing protein [Ovoidimarina sediminis]|uniref:helix-turn-helix domain-containing protein n=1 Tax=Ovoidimarina sediminis TaxID=3079856 RepID=UPI002909A736|nr:helix-turn-helix transcriptional regulator [Rhodophyticola sp. MJ-SS7]MDU8943900.1 helix-turn-helix transcriptional regulator [Rhodophyticola sp. MJ-SS7]
MDDALDNDWYSEDMATFGDRVAAAREALGMTDEELARRLGVRLKTVQGWEQDTAEPRANKLQLLAGVLNVSIRWLLTGEGEGIDAPDPTHEEDLAALLAEMRKLRVDMAQSAERLGRLEKRLKSAMRRAA